MNFEELSDDEWMQIAALVSDEPPIRLNRRGRPRAEPRVVANAVLWILTTGESWSRLPARYPSGPTCRRRFDDWHTSGTLAEIVQLLSQRGRTFAYVPPTAPPAPRPVVEVEEPVEDDGLPSVFWKSPEAWQAPSSAQGAACHDMPCADPMESITRQLANAASGRALELDDEDNSRDPRAALVQPTRASYPTRRLHEDNPVAARNTLWISATERSVQMAEWRGFAMNLTVQPVRNRMYRASVEILKDGLRVERSGLIGPPFNDRESAKQFAFDWGRRWIESGIESAIDSECAPAGVDRFEGVSDAVRGTLVTRTTSVSATGPAASVVTRAVPPAGVPTPQRLAPLHRLRPANLPTLADDYDANASDTGRHGVAPRLRTTHAG